VCIRGKKTSETGPFNTWSRSARRLLEVPAARQKGDAEAEISGLDAARPPPARPGTAGQRAFSSSVENRDGSRNRSVNPIRAADPAQRVLRSARNELGTKRRVVDPARRALSDLTRGDAFDRRINGSIE
jgi:hypothetical protein